MKIIESLRPQAKLPATELESAKDKFQKAMDGYRRMYGAKLFEVEALDLGFEELMNVPHDRLQDLLRQAGRDELEAMSMPKLVRWIKEKQKPKGAQKPIESFFQPDGFDKAEAAEFYQRFLRMKKLVQQNGLSWWQYLARKSAAWATAAAPKESSMDVDFFLKRGPGCVLTFAVMQPYLKTQPVWKEIQPEVQKPQQNEYRRTYSLGNAAAYKE